MCACDGLVTMCAGDALVTMCACDALVTMCACDGLVTMCDQCDSGIAIRTIQNAYSKPLNN